MDMVILPFFIFLELCKWIVFADIILSWLAIFGLSVRVPFFQAVIEPVYARLYRALPVRFAGLDFAPLVLLIFIQLLEALLLRLSPSIVAHIPYVPLF